MKNRNNKKERNYGLYRVSETAHDLKRGMLELIEKMVSIIVPIYNVEKFLGNCIDSIINQSYFQLEIILVDDASNDLSGEICKKYQEKDSRIVLLHHNSCQGVSKSRNDGLKIAKGEYISFIDADDSVDSKFVQKLVEAIEGNDIAITAYRKYTVSWERKYILDIEKCISQDDLMFHVLCTNQIGGYCFNKLYKRTLLKDIVFDECLTMGEDFLFLAQYLEKCSSYGYISELLYNYRVRTDSATCQMKNSRKFDLTKVCYIDAMDKLYDLLKKEFGSYQHYISYRVIRGNVWVMLQLIYCNLYNKKIIKQIKRTVSEHYPMYKKVKYGSLSQKIAVSIIIISPQILFGMGTFLCRFSPAFFERLIKE